jgi:gas vesicle protein
MSDERHSIFGTIVTFLTGAAIGAGLALLFAPQSGEETRKKIKDMGEKV